MLRKLFFGILEAFLLGVLGFGEYMPDSDVLGLLGE